jgi:hypothetical protein
VGPKLDGTSSNVPQPGAGLAQGSPAPSSRESSGRKSREDAGRRSASTKVARPGIEQSVGARVVSRLQKSERSIFPPFIAASRETSRGRGGVAGRDGSFLDEGSSHRGWRQGCGA